MPVPQPYAITERTISHSVTNHTKELMTHLKSRPYGVTEMCSDLKFTKMTSGNKVVGRQVTDKFIVCHRNAASLYHYTDDTDLLSEA